MITKIIIRNFKMFEEVEVDLGDTVVFVGPNDSGKTTALQALSLWNIGLQRWLEKHGQKGYKPKKRTGVAINRYELLNMPVPSTRLLWRDLHTQAQTKKIRIDIIVEGVSEGESWRCGLEFDYPNSETIYCRPLRTSEEDKPERMVIPFESSPVVTAFLPPMSGLAPNELRLDEGAINVRLGEGRTAEVLRNLCYQIFQERDNWNRLSSAISSLFPVSINEPLYNPNRGEVTLTYREKSGIEFDISSAGRGFQQTLLLLSYLYRKPSSVLLLDEPDAHLEILRQREIYGLLSDVARSIGSQLIIATHSEVLLNEAADKDLVIAFVGKPHPMKKTDKVKKALRDIRWDDYYQAEQTGWVLYLEGSSDLAMLKAFAEKLDHPLKDYLKLAFTHYVSNLPQKAVKHFHGLREAKSDLVGVALFDHLDSDLPERFNQRYLHGLMWEKREFENYFCNEKVLLAYAAKGRPDDLFEEAAQNRRIDAMNDSIKEITQALYTLGKGNPWVDDIKVSDEVINPLFEKYFSKLSLPKMEKGSFYKLIEYLDKDDVSQEVIDKLDAILEVAKRATPLG